MPKYALDSNVYISAFRDPSKALELKQFLARTLSFTYFVAPVAQELRAGVQTRAQLTAFRYLIDPFERRQRLIAPSARGFIEGGRILAELRAKEHWQAPASSFVNDVMIAVSCRENGLTLITNNASDFARIRQVLRSFSFVAPWPSYR